MSIKQKNKVEAKVKPKHHGLGLRLFWQGIEPFIFHVF
jgi:hypothetical protein